MKIKQVNKTVKLDYWIDFPKKWKTICEELKKYSGIKNIKIVPCEKE